MTFQKGISGNPRGRPKKGAALAEFIRYTGELKYHGTDQTYRERAVRALWEQAAKGYLPALQFIAERTEGKVPQRMEHTGADGGPMEQSTVIEVHAVDYRHSIRALTPPEREEAAG